MLLKNHSRPCCWLSGLLLVAIFSWLSPERACGQGMVKIWRCTRCGQNLGEGLQRPTYCHNCTSGNARSKSDTGAGKSKDGKRNMAVVIGVGFFLLVGATAYILRDSGTKA